MRGSSDDWNKLKHLVDLSAENARLKAEVAYLKGEEHPYADLGSMMPKYLLEHWLKENARLKEEVEKLRKFNDEALAHIAKEERKSRECLDMVQAEVERLIKAGDNLITALDKRDDVFDNSDKRQAIADWNAAKEDSQA